MSWFSWFKSDPTTIITRNELRSLIFEQCGLIDITPLNKVYIAVPSKRWVRRNTPNMGAWLEDYNDCNHFAVKAMAAMQSHCFGIVITKTNDPRITHTLNVLVLATKEVLLYDSASKSFFLPSKVGAVIDQFI